MSGLISRLTLNAAIVALLVGSLVVQTVRIEGFKVWPLSHKGLKAELAEVRQTLREIGEKRNEQRKETERRMGGTRIIYRNVETPARRIENAPTAQNCATPPEIMGAEL